MDIPTSCRHTVSDLGFQVTEGTFGTPFVVDKEDDWHWVPRSADVPSLVEHDIVFLDMDGPPAEELAVREKAGEGIKDFWQHQGTGTITPRPISAFAYASQMMKAVAVHGTALVAFVSHKSDITYYVQRDTPQRGKSRESEVVLSNWSLFGPLADKFISPEYFNVQPLEGTAVSPMDPSTPWGQVLQSHCSDMHYEVSLGTSHSNAKLRWTPILKNRHGAIVGGVVQCGKGTITLLPRFAHVDDVVRDIVSKILPVTSPYLFPHHVKGAWTQDAQYELPGVKVIEAERTAVLIAHTAKQKELDDQIARERQNNGFLHSILKDTGEPLSMAVKTALIALDFRDVRVPPEEAGVAAKNPQEDLQIHDASPIVLVEVKGLAGNPTEADTQQVHKYVLRRAKEWRRTDIRALTIVNHQRHLPPHQRTNGVPFTEAQIGDAMANDQTLITGHTLYRLICGMRKHAWPAKSVRDLLVQDGEVGLIPTCYSQVGSIAKAYPEQRAVGIQLTAALAVGQTIAIAFEGEYHEQIVAGLQVNRQPVVRAEAGERVGLQLTCDVGRSLEVTDVFVRIDLQETLIERR